MSKLLVAPKHNPAPMRNGSDGCYARWGGGLYGVCPGKKIAEWLNGLGEDDEPFGKTGSTNLDVRLNWLRGDDHIVALEPEAARLKGEAQQAQRKLNDINQRLIAITGEELYE